MARPRDESKIEVIYEATLKLVLETGFNGLKMADVAKEAKLATGTLYIYFKNKEVLINELYFHLKKNKTLQMLEVFDVNDSFSVAFKKLWFNYLNISLAEPERMKFIEQFTHTSYLTKKTKQQGDQLLKPLEDFLLRGMKQGVVKKLPTQLLLSQLMGPIIESVKLHYDQTLKITPVLKEELFKMAWNSIKV
jgi:TetR/AcrR family transcriptional regulator, repressor of fatR-cypB operon